MILTDIHLCMNVYIVFPDNFLTIYHSLFNYFVIVGSVRI